MACEDPAKFQRETGRFPAQYSLIRRSFPFMIQRM